VNDRYLRGTVLIRASLPPKGLGTRGVYIPDLHIDKIKVKARYCR
jgi:hypothetical protein